ncbi:MAG TPA: DUF1328 domain-containing protein [Bacteriovoracaceae bacterium]|nr:DUF1328 domain-containing protein [Bacteriovoracaceae bacterium]
MLRAAIIFFILGIVSMVLGINGIAGLSIEIGKILLVVFVVLSILSFLVGRRGGGTSRLLSLALVAVLGGATFMSISAQADDTVKGTVEEAGNDAKRGSKKTVRAVKDKTCEMVNGKMDCTIKKVKHSMQNGADKVEDAVD